MINKELAEIVKIIRAKLLAFGVSKKQTTAIVDAIAVKLTVYYVSDIANDDKVPTVSEVISELKK